MGYEVVVDHEKCEGCEECVEVCPVDCIPHDPDRPETQEELMEKYKLLTGNTD